MEFIKLQTLTLHTFESNNKDNLDFLKELINDESIKKWFTGLAGGLLINKNKEFFGYSFFVKDNSEFIGYVNIGNYNKNEKSVYLRAAISKNKRGKGYGKTLLSEITEYIFANFKAVESIRLKIDKENTTSLMTANACGYEWLSDDFYIKYNSYIKKVK